MTGSRAAGVAVPNSGAASASPATQAARSIRMTCALSIRWPSPVIFSTALRTEASYGLVGNQDHGLHVGRVLPIRVLDDRFQRDVVFGHALGHRCEDAGAINAPTGG